MAGHDGRVLVGTDTADDAGVFLLDGRALVATTDFITPVCDDPHRFGRVAAANSLSDVFAMGGEVLFVLNIAMFPEKVAAEALAGILAGAAEATREAGAVVLGGHSVRDPELKFGLAVVGVADPDRLLTNAGARPGDTLVLTKPLGTGVLINAYKADKLDAEGLEPALVEMERLNLVASRLALAHGAGGATDVTGFGLLGHALGMARASNVGLEIRFADLPVHAAFARLVRRGVTTGCTRDNEQHVAPFLVEHRRFERAERDILFDPQTSGGLLVAVPGTAAAPLLTELRATGHAAVAVGRVLDGPPRIEVT